MARIAWLVDGGVDPATIAAIAFNRRAADELRERLDAAIEPLGVAPGGIRVRTFHALGGEILRSAGRPTNLVDRGSVLRELDPAMRAATLRRLDTTFSRLKLDLDVRPEAIEADPAAGPAARAYVAYERALAERGAIDFDDLVAGALRSIEDDPALLERWQAACGNLLVDEAQDLDRSQLRLAILLAGPAARVFFVGDDDQSIYGWRLADVRRTLALAGTLAGLRRVDLEVNYRCPPAVVARALRLVEHNRERFAKRVRPGSRAKGSLILAPDGADDAVRIGRIIDGWAVAEGSMAILARTNRELAPAAIAALARRIPFRTGRLRLLVEEDALDDLLARLRAAADGRPLLVQIADLRAELAATPPEAPRPNDDAPTLDELAAALLCWAAPYASVAALEAAIVATRRLLAELRREDARLTLATAHGTKGLEFDHVAVIGLDAGRFPSGRALAESSEPERALEEERRLAYVAWTRARRSLTLLYDPAAPSPFLLEAFEAAELNLEPTGLR